MSAPPLSKVLRFILIAAGIIIVLSVIWSFIDSAYSDFLATIARKVIYKATVEQREGSLYFSHYTRYMGGWLQINDTIHVSTIQFGLILTIALVAATPGLNLKRRFLYTGVAAMATFVLQIFSIIVMAKTFNSLFFLIVSDLFPPLLWAAFSLRYWLKKA
jgi:hypothetical protein